MRYSTNSRRSLRVALLTSLTILSVLLLYSCILPTSIIPLLHNATDPVVVCAVTVRNPQAQREDGVEKVPDQPLTSRDPLFLDEDGSVLRPYYLGNQCGVESAGQQKGFADLAAARNDWALFVKQRIDSAASNPQAPRAIRDFPDGWCMEPATLNCVSIDEAILTCTSRPALTNATPIPDCLPAEPQAACIEIQCGSDTPCTGLEFADVSVGTTVSKEIVLQNCAGSGGPAVEVTLDGDVAPVGNLFDFDVPVDNNQCHFTNGESGFVELPTPNGQCSFAVDFTPNSRGEHRGEIRFTSNVRNGVHSIALTGNGLGGELKFETDDQVDPGQLPPLLCVDDLIDGECTNPRQIKVRNIGPGGVNINNIRLDQNQGFQLLNPPQTPTLLSNVDEPLSVQFQWCGTANDREVANLVIDSDDPAQPTFVQPLLREPGDCSPIAAYGFEGQGDQIQDITGNGNGGTLVGPAQRTQENGGMFGKAIEFNGINGHVDLGNELAPSGDQLTIAFWMNAVNFDNEQARFIAKATGRNPQEQYWMVGTAQGTPNVGNKLRFRVKTPQDGTTTQESEAVLEVDQWTHVAATYNGEQMIIYKDGVSVAEREKSGDIVIDPDIIVWIGDSPPNGTRAFNGRVDELRIYNRALNADEIQYIMNKPLQVLNNP